MKCPRCVPNVGTLGLLLVSFAGDMLQCLQLWTDGPSTHSLKGHVHSKWTFVQHPVFVLDLLVSHVSCGWLPAPPGPPDSRPAEGSQTTGIHQERHVHGHRRPGDAALLLVRCWEAAAASHWCFDCRRTGCWRETAPSGGSMATLQFSSRWCTSSTTLLL